VSATAEPIRQLADQLGERVVTPGAGSPTLTLRVSPQLSSLPDFRRALAARCQAMTAVESPWLARLLDVQQPAGDQRGFTLVFEGVRGERLSRLIRRRRDERRPLALAQVYYLVREAVAAVRALHASGPGMCHGALSASRFVLNTEGRLVLQDAVFGSALGALAWPAARMREELGVRVPELPGIPSFTPLTDQLQLGLLTLHMITGTPVDDAPSASLAAMCSDARLPAAGGDACPLPDDFRAVLVRTLLVSADGPFRSMLALDRALEAAVATDSDNPPAPPEIALEDWTPQVIAFAAAPAPAEAQESAILLREGTTGETLPPIPPWWEPPAVSSVPSVQARTQPFGEAFPEPPLQSERERPDLFDTSPHPFGQPEKSKRERPEPAAVRTAPADGEPAPPSPATLSAPPAPSEPSPVIGIGAPRHGPAPGRNSLRWEPEESGFEVAGSAAGAYWKAKTEVFSQPERPPRQWGRIGAIAGFAVLALAVGSYLLGASAMKSLGGPAPGHLFLESKPAGATVVIEGVDRGKTPLVLRLPPGTYRVEFSLGDESKAVTVPVSEGADAQQAVSLYPAGPPGRLDVTSVPTGAAVTVDGEPRGKSPVSVPDVAPGEHVVAVESPVGRVERVVEVLAGAQVPVNLPLSGILEVQAPFEVMVFDKAKALGTVRSGRFPVSAGRRQITFANDELQYEENRDVDVPAGEVTRVVLSPPTGMLNFTSDTNHETEVFLDDRPLGPTPLRNVQVSLGTHEVLFRHAKWGEQRYTILVSLGSPARLHAVMEQKQITVTRPPPRYPSRR
jgi:serine/threonine protein kinase